uniref:Conserved oligomeric Golgi complex subunit 1 n=1 Tax=Ananas comosus var. bracteatus TaxID=296719 RepID=A0A6V7NJ54_ANACO|nr:unnamed protein product [Ananas comosus var. bracteatus]
MLCGVAGMIRGTLGQVGGLFALSLNEMSLFYKIVLTSSPGTQLFGGIPNPEEEEVRLWRSHKEKLEIVWGEVLDSHERKRRRIRVHGEASLRVFEWMEGLERSLERWLRSVPGTVTMGPDLLAYLEGRGGHSGRSVGECICAEMKGIVHSEFENLSKDLNLRSSIKAIVANTDSKEGNGFLTCMRKFSTGGGVWFAETNQKKVGILHSLKPIPDENDFQSRLNSYFGHEVSRIRDALDSKC